MEEINFKNSKPEARRLSDIKEVLYDKEWAKNAPDSDLYYIHRGIKQGGGLRYDITAVPAKMLGREFVKTKGNRNSEKFLELYTVIRGEAIFLFQKMDGGKIKDVFAIKAKKGESVINPVGYYIISINPSKKLLKLANWVPKKNKNIYKEIKKMQGACYFYTKDGWIKNKNYKKVPKLRFEKPLKSVPENLSFLKQE